MTDRYKVIRPCMLWYGSINKATINMNRGQMWELVTLPSKGNPFYGLYRHGTTIELCKEDFAKIFEGVKE